VRLTHIVVVYVRAERTVAQQYGCNANRRHGARDVPSWKVRSVYRFSNYGLSVRRTSPREFHWATPQILLADRERCLERTGCESDSTLCWHGISPNSMPTSASEWLLGLSAKGQSHRILDVRSQSRPWHLDTREFTKRRESDLLPCRRVTSKRACSSLDPLER
jgi:hypothetical protein